jgi:predicted anti-sigma-YlaC factor YlaD
MGCREIREIISSYVDGEARPEEARMVEEHLGGCPQCRQAEKRMRDLGIAVARAEGAAPPDFREKLFARMEKEDLLPKRRSIFAYSVRWAVVPLAAAAAIAFFVHSSREVPRDHPSTAMRPPAATGIGGELSPEDREIVASLDVLEDPDLFDETEIEELEFFAPPPRQRG